MTIKEAEIRTGLARANIRYYEEQGFFSAARGKRQRLILRIAIDIDVVVMV